MRTFATSLSAVALFSLFMQFIATAPANAIDAELADKCRRLMIKAYPHQSPGKKKGMAATQRKYFQDCIKNNGIMPETDGPNPPPRAPR